MRAGFQEGRQVAGSLSIRSCSTRSTTEPLVSSMAVISPARSKH